MEIKIKKDYNTVDGYVNVVARDSKKIYSPTGCFTEQVLPRVWSRALRKADDVKLLFNHEKDRELGSIEKGNLELYEDAIGLRVKCKIYDKEVIKESRLKNIKGWSFGFVAKKDRWENIKNGLKRRYLVDIDLIEVSILTEEPAYTGCLAEVRGSTEWEIRYVFDSELEELRAFHEQITYMLDLKE